jgi:hypothetical protein
LDQRISKISVLTFAVKISSPKNIISVFFLIISQPKLQIWNKTRPKVHSLQFGFQNFENKKSNFSQIPNLKTETKLSTSQTENLEKQIRKSPSKCYNSSNFVQNLEHKISNLAQIQKCPQTKPKILQTHSLQYYSPPAAALVASTKRLNGRNWLAPVEKNPQPAAFPFTPP